MEMRSLLSETATVLMILGFVLLIVSLVGIGVTLSVIWRLLMHGDDT